MAITAEQVKELREKTGAGMMDAKNALVEAGGDMDKASELLRQKGLATASKKGGRQTAEGQVVAAIAPDGASGVLLEVNCETDFVARGEAFGALLASLSQQALAALPADAAAFLACPGIQDGVTQSVAQIKENITVRRLASYRLSGAAGLVHAYIHTGGKIGVMLELACANPSAPSQDAFRQLAKDICMQLASAGADFVQTSDIPQDVIDEEKRIEMGKDDLQNKPLEIREKIVAGRVAKLMSQRVLVEQPFVKDPGKTIGDLLNDASAPFGGPVSVVRFTRFLLGEGIEKKSANFAEEVMAQLR